MSSKLKHILALISIPLVLAVIYTSVMILWKVFHLPSDAEMLVLVKSYFAHYGLWIVFVCAIIEGFLLLGQYFPGGFVIFLSVVATNGNVPLAVLTVSVISLAFFISYSLNYLVGKYGFYKLFIRFGLAHSFEKAKAKLEKHGLSAVMFSYWDPNFASVTATAAGVLHISFKKFSLYSAIGVIVWDAFWGTFAFIGGEAIFRMAGLGYMLGAFAIWIVVLLVKYYFDSRHKKVPSPEIDEGTAIS